MKVEEADKINRRLLNKLNQGEEVKNYRQEWYNHGEDMDEPAFEPIIKKNISGNRIENDTDLIRELRRKKEAHRDELLNEDNS